MTWRCLSTRPSGEVVRVEYFTTEAEAQQHAVAHTAQGFLCSIKAGTLAADGTFTPVA